MKRNLFLLTFLSIFGIRAASHDLDIKQVVIWGHKLHSHTHSYIHWAFYRTFTHLGYKTLWLDNHDDITKIDFENSLFITEGQVDGNMPLREDCHYILHNCFTDRYDSLKAKGNCICLQVYTHDCLPRKVRYIDNCIYADESEKCIYMPWATDLLPYEIDEIKEQIRTRKVIRSNIVYWVGTISDGKPFDNNNEINGFRRAALEAGVGFERVADIDMKQNIELIQRSYLAPAIQGPWQIKVGYVPCRIFKNISYGQLGVTNSETVSKLFKNKIVYNPDCYRLFFDAQVRAALITQEEMFELMDFVRDKHTYINRIEHLLQFLKVIEASVQQEKYKC